MAAQEADALQMEIIPNPKESLSSKTAGLSVIWLSWQSSHVLIVLTVEVIVLYSACTKLMLSSYSQLETSAGPVI